MHMYGRTCISKRLTAIFIHVKVIHRQGTHVPPVVMAAIGILICGVIQCSGGAPIGQPLFNGLSDCSFHVHQYRRNTRLSTMTFLATFISRSWTNCILLDCNHNLHACLVRAGCSCSYWLSEDRLVAAWTERCARMHVCRICATSHHSFST